MCDLDWFVVSPARSTSVFRFGKDSGRPSMRCLEPLILVLGGGPMEPLLKPLRVFRSLWLVSRRVFRLPLDIIAGSREGGLMPLALGRTFSSCEGGRSMIACIPTLVHNAIINP